MADLDKLARVGLAGMAGDHAAVWTTEPVAHVPIAAEPSASSGAGTSSAIGRAAADGHSAISQEPVVVTLDPSTEPVAPRRFGDTISRRARSALLGLGAWGRKLLDSPTGVPLAPSTSNPVPSHPGFGLGPHGLIPKPAPLRTMAVTANTASQVGSKPLMGHGVQSSDVVNIYGSDLGFVATLKGKTYVVFGDTWSVTGKSQITFPQKPAVVDSLGPFDPAGSAKPVRNDSMGEVTMNLPNGFPEIKFNSVVAAGKSVYRPIAVSNDGGIPLGDGATAGAAFATSNFLYIWLKRAAPEGIQLARYTEGQGDPKYSNFISIGAPLNERVAYPMGGALVDTDLFLNVAVYDKPSLLDDALLPPDVKRPIFVWGRPLFWEFYPGATDLRLMLFDADVLDSIQDTTTPLPVHFFAGFDEDSKPIWSPDPTQAEVLTGDGSELAAVNQASVTYDENLDVWIMIYGGRTVSMFANVLGAAYDDMNAGIVLRWAPQPWGPWSAKQQIFNGSKKVYCQMMFDGVSWGASDKMKLEKNPGPNFCSLLPDLAPASLIQPPKNQTVNPVYFLDPGKEYGVSIWHVTPNANLGSTRSSSFYFAMSTLNPYHVILMQTTITRVY